jgi:hypothetical protein
MNVKRIRMIGSMALAIWAPAAGHPQPHHVGVGGDWLEFVSPEKVSDLTATTAACNRTPGKPEFCCPFVEQLTLSLLSRATTSLPGLGQPVRTPTTIGSALRIHVRPAHSTPTV